MRRCSRVWHHFRTADEEELAAVAKEAAEEVVENDDEEESERRRMNAPCSKTIEPDGQDARRGSEPWAAPACGVTGWAPGAVRHTECSCGGG